MRESGAAVKPSDYLVGEPRPLSYEAKQKERVQMKRNKWNATIAQIARESFAHLREVLRIHWLEECRLVTNDVNGVKKVNKGGLLFAFLLDFPIKVCGLTETHLK